MVFVPQVPANDLPSIVDPRLQNWLQSAEDNTSEHSPLAFLDVILEGLIDGVMILDVQGRVLRANLQARALCQKLLTLPEAVETNQDSNLWQLPAAIRSIFAALLDSRSMFPNQRFLPEFETHLSDHTPLRIRGQFLDIPKSEEEVPYVFITIEDRRESLRGAALGDAQRFGLTPREAEVWYLRLLGESYRDIANTLYITENTVRKHIKSILAKRRVELDEEVDRNA
jgi:DNA-binding CsgD family transcriptional regulator